MVEVLFLLVPMKDIAHLWSQGHNRVRAPTHDTLHSGHRWDLGLYGLAGKTLILHTHPLILQALAFFTTMEREKTGMALCRGWVGSSSMALTHFSTLWILLACSQRCKEALCNFIWSSFLRQHTVWAVFFINKILYRWKMAVNRKWKFDTCDKMHQGFVVRILGCTVQLHEFLVLH